jgi:hypothetical protein
MGSWEWRGRRWPPCSVGERVARAMAEARGFHGGVSWVCINVYIYIYIYSQGVANYLGPYFAPRGLQSARINLVVHVLRRKPLFPLTGLTLFYFKISRPSIMPIAITSPPMVMKNVDLP